LQEGAICDSLCLGLIEEAGMSRVGLFENLPETAAPEHGGADGKPRMREPVRDQIELRATDIDSLIGSDHPARVIWGYAERRELEKAIKAREGMPGGRRSHRVCCWRCGFTPPARGLAARGRSPG
jgi:hypothetical protein